MPMVCAEWLVNPARMCRYSRNTSGVRGKNQDRFRVKIIVALVPYFVINAHEMRSFSLLAVLKTPTFEEIQLLHLPYEFLVSLFRSI